MNKPTFTIQDSMQRKIKYENYKFIFENNIYVSHWRLDGRRRKENQQKREKDTSILL